MSAGPRSGAQRRHDTEHRLTNDIDLWVASASADDKPYLVPLSFDWDGEALLVPRRRTARPAGTWLPPGPSGWGWATPATCL
jgi:hypothetical protein